ncbi:MAG: zf-HC2 domain-containing protein [Gemmatimonadetes bacterium]|nr:zf-HC2 domain-containing protein [Gemmatimonadota bacterium]
MPHVDEGTLHALLDGALRAMDPEQAEAVEAHLESCAECRALAAEAAALRGRAGEVLSVLEPDVAPDFEEVLVRAGTAGAVRGRTGLARQARWTRGLAWAATIVIALGTGYLIRDRLVPERAASFSVEAPAESGARRSEPGSQAPAAPRPETEQSIERTPPGDGGGADTPTAAGEEAEEVPAGVAGAAADVTTDAAVAQPEAERRTRVAPAPPQPTPAVAAAQPASGAAEARAADERARESLVPVESAPALSDRVGQEPVALQEMAVVAASPAPGARVVTPEEAAEVLGAPFLVLPRAEVTLVTVEPGEAGEVVVSLQRLAEGAVIRVTQGPEREPAPLGRPADARALSAAPARSMRMKAAADESDGSSTVRVRVSGAELVLEGALPPDVLELLGGAAAPYARPR